MFAIMAGAYSGETPYTHSGLLQKFVNYGNEKFYNIGPYSHIHKTFFLQNVWMGKFNEGGYPWAFLA